MTAFTNNLKSSPFATASDGVQSWAVYKSEPRPPADPQTSSLAECQHLDGKWGTSTALAAVADIGTPENIALSYEAALGRSLFFVKDRQIYYRTFNSGTGGAWSADTAAEVRNRMADEVGEGSKLAASATTDKIYVYYLSNRRCIVELVGTPPEHGPNEGTYSWMMPEEQGVAAARANSFLAAACKLDDRHVAYQLEDGSLCLSSIGSNGSWNYDEIVAVGKADDDTPLALKLSDRGMLTVFYVHTSEGNTTTYALDMRRDRRDPKVVALHSGKIGLGLFKVGTETRVVSISNMDDRSVFTERIEETPGVWVMPGIIQTGY